MSAHHCSNQSFSPSDTSVGNLVSRYGHFQLILTVLSLLPSKHHINSLRTTHLHEPTSPPVPCGTRERFKTCSFLRWIFGCALIGGGWLCAARPLKNSLHLDFGTSRDSNYIRAPNWGIFGVRLLFRDLCSSRDRIEGDKVLGRTDEKDSPAARSDSRTFLRLLRRPAASVRTCCKPKRRCQIRSMVLSRIRATYSSHQSRRRRSLAISVEVAVDMTDDSQRPTRCANANLLYAFPSAT
ncbi:hypothetical protein EDD85DRAFT_153716 [Armillaria nabsnona]|nr:hypothetical protein EDD85DRAFT_153716 [Armillaria nabsnona]